MRRAIYIWFTMVLLLLITVGDLSAQNQHSRERLHRKYLLQNTERHLLAFYNVENLFDTLNSPTTVDEDMLPLADREWNGERLSRKIDLIARVITDMRCDGQLPAIMALAEVENRQGLSIYARTRLCKMQITKFATRIAPIDEESMWHCYIVPNCLSRKE